MHGEAYLVALYRRLEMECVRLDRSLASGNALSSDECLAHGALRGCGDR